MPASLRATAAEMRMDPMSSISENTAKLNTKGRFGLPLISTASGVIEARRERAPSLQGHIYGVPRKEIPALGPTRPQNPRVVLVIYLK